MQIYVASSWRNPRHDEAVKALREAGHKVYDYRGQDPKFAWEQIDPEYAKWDAPAYLNALHSRTAQEAFWRDFDALQSADAVIGIEPLGVSSALELGWAAGAGKQTFLLVGEEVKPELMSKMVTFRVRSIQEAVAIMEALRGVRGISTADGAGMCRGARSPDIWSGTGMCLFSCGAIRMPDGCFSPWMRILCQTGRTSRTGRTRKEDAMQIRIECRFEKKVPELTELIRKHRDPEDKSLDAFCRACKDAAYDLGRTCYFRLTEAPGGGFEVVAVFL